MKHAIPLTLALVLASSSAHADIGVVVTGEATLQPQLAAQVEGWLRQRGHTVIASALEPDAINTLIDCFVLEDLGCARKLVETRAKSQTIVFARVEITPNETDGSRTVSIVGYWLQKGHDAIAERRICQRCLEEAMRSTAEDLMTALAAEPPTSTHVPVPSPHGGPATEAPASAPPPTDDGEHASRLVPGTVIGAGCGARDHRCRAARRQSGRLGDGAATAAISRHQDGWDRRRCGRPRDDRRRHLSVVSSGRALGTGGHGHPRWRGRRLDRTLLGDTMNTKSLLIAIALLAGCEKTNPNYCPDNIDNNCNEGPTVDAPGGSASCTVTACATGVCDTVSGSCVQCTSTQASACTGTTPVCGTNDMCQACTDDSQCGSSACLPDGSCAESSAILYASSSGDSAGSCSLTDMCTIDQALAIADSTQHVIKLAPGTYGTAGLAVTQSVTILGRGAIVDKNMGGNGPVFTTATASTTVELDYMTIQGGDDSGVGHGISCTGASLIVHGATSQNNSAIGISAQNCNLTIARATVYHNAEGGLLIAGSGIQFDITDTFVIRNGNTTDGTFGGVNISTTSVGTSRFEFNTVADNSASTGVNHFGGMICDIAGFTAGDNIVAQNVLHGLVTANEQTEGACTFPASLVQDDETGLAFVNATTAPYSYKIQSASTAKDTATFPSLVDVDNEGDFRPQGVQKDIGADEFKQ